jgi:hypothetical protein
MPVHIIVGVVLLGFIILVMSGLGILTTAVFGILDNDNNKDIKTGKNTINLEGANLTVAKISLITFWILITIAIIGLPFFK